MLFLWLLPLLQDPAFEATLSSRTGADLRHLDPQVVTGKPQLLWSPDGTRVSVTATACPGTPVLFLYDVAGGGTREIALPGIDEPKPPRGSGDPGLEMAWSRDSESLAVVETQNAVIWIVARDGSIRSQRRLGALQKLTDYATVHNAVRDLAWFPDHRSLLVVGYTAGLWRVTLSDDGRAEERLVSAEQLRAHAGPSTKLACFGWKEDELLDDGPILKVPFWATVAQAGGFSFGEMHEATYHLEKRQFVGRPVPAGPARTPRDYRSASGRRGSALFSRASLSGEPRERNQAILRSGKPIPDFGCAIFEAERMRVLALLPGARAQHWSEQGDRLAVFSATPKGWLLTAFDLGD